MLKYMNSKNTRSTNFFKCAMCLILLCCLCYTSAVAQVTKIEIDTLRKKHLLRQPDLTMITDFVNEQFGKLLGANDPADLSSITRKLVVTAEPLNPQPATKQSYSDTYTAAVQNAYKDAFGKLASFRDQELADQIKNSIVVILANCNNSLIIDDLTSLLDDKSEFVRYWAVRGVGMPVIQGYLTSDDSKAELELQKVITGLRSLLQKETSAFVVAQIVNTAPVNEVGINLIKECVTARVKLYQSWQVDNEKADWQILQKIFDIINSKKLEDQTQLESNLVRSAVELFSLAFNRYTKSFYSEGENGKTLDLLSEMSRRELTSLLILSEMEFLRISDNQRRPRFAGLLQKQKIEDMQNVFNSMVRPKGELDRKYKIYPTDAQQPDLPELGPVPPEVVQKAKNLSLLHGQP